MARSAASQALAKPRNILKRGNSWNPIRSVTYNSQVIATCNGRIAGQWDTGTASQRQAIYVRRALTNEYPQFWEISLCAKRRSI